MVEQRKAKAKGRKIGRNRKHQATAYRAHAERNRKRRIRRHLRDHPRDLSNAEIYTRDYGDALDVGITARGQRRMARYRRAVSAAMKGYRNPLRVA